MAASMQVEQQVGAKPAAVYYAFTNNTALSEWLCGFALVHPNPGQNLYLLWQDGYYAAGSYTEVVENERLRFTWRGKDEPAASEVTVVLAPAGGGTRVTVTHSGLPDGSADAQRSRWASALENLASTLETGIDLRYARRPMLGVFIDEVSEDLAARVGLPDRRGIALTGVLDGMSAQRAGLGRDDVLLAIDGQETPDFFSLGAVMSSKQAGDTVRVTYFRDGARHTMPLMLMPPPIQEVPAAPADLAAEVERHYAEGLAKLEAFLDGVSEGEADFLPGAGEWSVRQTLGHLIANERDNHPRASITAAGLREPEDGFWNNSLLRILPILESYPTLPELAAELRRCMAQTVSMLRHLPPEFLERKASYRRLAVDLLEYAAHHINEHFDQMERALAAARVA